MIFRLLSADSNKTYRRRLALLVPRNVTDQHLQQLKVLLKEFPDRLVEFRRRVLPYSGLHLLLNVASCGCFIFAVWFFPPREMQRWDLLFVQYGSLLVVPLAFIADAVNFGRLLVATFARDAEVDGAV